MYRYLSVAAFVSTRTPWRVPPWVTLGWGGVVPYPTPGDRSRGPVREASREASRDTSREVSQDTLPGGCPGPVPGTGPLGWGRALPHPTPG